MYKSIIFQIGYILKLKASYKYKIGYCYSLLLKLYYQVFFRKYIYSKFPFPGEYIIENTLGKFLILEPSDMHSLLNTQFENDIYNYFLKNQEGVFLDIGANVGKFTVMVGLKTNMHIYAFEPNPRTFSYLLKNIELNNLVLNTNASNIGFGEKREILSLTIPEDSFGSASIVNLYSNLNCKKVDVHIFPGDDFMNQNNIDIGDIRLIKIDVEGYEYDVLKGMSNILKECKNTYIIIEIFPHNTYKNDILNTLRNNNFNLIFTGSGDNFIFFKT